MSEIFGWYYLHTNNDLIFKRGADAIDDIRESDFCKDAWAWTGDRPCAWGLLVEANCVGANKLQINNLVEKWGCNNEDAKVYAEYLGIELGMEGTSFTAKKKDFIDLAVSPCGFGDSYLDAMSDLCKQLGYLSSKTWGTSFELLTAV